MRVIRLSTSKGIEAVEKEILNSLQFFFGWHLKNISFELENRIEKNKGITYMLRYTYETPRGRKTGRFPHITLYQPSKGEYVLLVPDEPAIVMALSHGLSQIADAIDVNIGNYNPKKNAVIPTGRVVDANPHTINIAINSAITSLLLDRKLEPRVFLTALTYGNYVVVYSTTPRDDPLDTFVVELEIVYDSDIAEIGIDAKGHSKHVKVSDEPTIKIEEEFVYVGDAITIETKLDKRGKK